MTTHPAKTALVIRANGHIEIVPNKGLASLQKAVGGLIEPIHLGRDAVMYVNEEGLLNSLPLNVVATQIVRHEYPLWSRFAGLWGWPHAHPGPIVGDVVIVVVDPETGEYGDHPYLLEEAAVFLSEKNQDWGFTAPSPDVYFPRSALLHSSLITRNAT